MKNQNWYNITNINEHTYIFEENRSSKHNNSYLLLGKNRALMIDTGTGENEPVDDKKIINVINEIKPKDLPLTLLLSHFHYDHNQNMEEFDHVAFPKLPFLEEQVVNNEYKFTKDNLYYGNHPEKTHVDEWFPINQDIDLGDRIIELIHSPGHAPELVVILDKTNKIAFISDVVTNAAMFIFDKKHIPIYNNTFKKLLNIVDESYTFYGGHRKPEVSYERIVNASKLLEDIANGSLEPIDGDVHASGSKWDIWKEYDISLYLFKK